MFRNHVHPVIIVLMFRNFINIVRDPKATDEGDDELVDDTIPHIALPVSLPPPAIGNLDIIDTMVQQSVMTPAGRESLVTFIHEERYLYKLVETFNECEDMEDLDGLHRLSSIMKTLSISLTFRVDFSSD